MQKRCTNPLLPLSEFIPDVEARVFTNSRGEQRVYLYGSHDEFGSDTWCSYQYRVYSSPVTDLAQWTDHGVSFASRKGQGYVWNGEDATGISWWDKRLYAPDVQKIGERYCLVTCCEGGCCLGMAVSDQPEGPFSPAKKIRYDDGSDTASIDPTIYAEGETVYLFWGQRPQFGARGLLGAELEKDEDGLYTIVKKETERVLFTGEGDPFGFYEGASIRKINGRYYILYPSDHGKGEHMMSYAVADNPLGPYAFGGDILDNDGCDLRPGNNHGSFCQINGQWYLFYHRGFGNSNMQRKVCVEKIYFDKDGRISDGNGNLVPMTNHGFGGPLDPYQETEAAYATHVRLDGFPSGCYFTEEGENCHPLIHIQDGNCVEYRDFDFGEAPQPRMFTAAVMRKHGGQMEVLLDTLTSEPVAVVTVPAGVSDKYQEISVPAAAITGVHTVYLKFRGEAGKDICQLKSFRFHERMR